MVTRMFSLTLVCLNPYMFSLSLVGVFQPTRMLTRMFLVSLVGVFQPMRMLMEMFSLSVVGVW